LLTPDEQKVFRRLGVFVNGCTLEAAEAVCNPSEDLTTNVLDGMESLAGQSLIHQTQMADGEPRFSMLETIREYAVERLVHSPDEALTRRVHAAYCLVLAEEGSEQTTAAESDAWVARCDLELDNFRSALDWTIRTRQTEWGLRLGAALHEFWGRRESYVEGRERLLALLQLPADEKTQKVRARVLFGAADMSWNRGDHSTAQDMLRVQLEIYRALGDVAWMLTALNGLGAGYYTLGELESARAVYEQCLKLSQDAGNERGVAQTLNNLAMLRQASNDFAGAKPLCEQALAIFTRIQDISGAAWLQSRIGDLERKSGDLRAAAAAYERAMTLFEKSGDRRGLARTMVDFAVLMFEEGNHTEAHATLGKAIKSFQDMGNRRGVARAMQEFAEFAACRGDANRALRLAGAAGALRHSIGAAVLDGHDRSANLDAARRALGNAALDAEMAGWAMGIEAAIQYALDAR
jgi:tetratricopeptide (TPR) repeat protein